MAADWKPAFLVIGAYKSGTTSVHHALRSHPQLFVPRRKEPGFFAFEGVAPGSHPKARESIRDIEEYRALFAPAPEHLLRGEVSPAYMTSPTACANIARHVPDARLIAVLRDPTERAYSDYLMYVRDGIEPHDDFGRALDEQDERCRQGLPTGHYVTTGFYGAQLQPYLDTFGAERVLVVVFEELARDFPGGMRRIYRFLGVDDSHDAPDGHARNEAGVPRGAASRAALRLRRRGSPALRRMVPTGVKDRVDRLLQRRLDRPPLPPDQRARLIEIYAADIARLERLLGRDLPDWSREEGQHTEPPE